MHGASDVESTGGGPQTSTTASPSTQGRKRSKTSKGPLRLAQACDQCHGRKIKCLARDGIDPRQGCLGCSRAEVMCTWARHVQRRGPKWKSWHHGTMSRGEASGLERRQEDSTGDEGVWPWLDHSETDITVPPLTSETTDNSSSIPANLSPPSPTPIVQHQEWTTLPLPSFDLPASDAMWESIWSNLGTDPSTFMPFPQPTTTSQLNAKIGDYPSAALEAIFDQTPRYQLSLRSPPGSSQGVESVVHSATSLSTDQRSMVAALPLPESSNTIQRRLESFFPDLAAYIPVLSRSEMMTAFAEGAHDRSIHYRALMLSTVALGSTVSVVASNRHSITASNGDSSNVDSSNHERPDLTRDLVYTYMMQASSTLSLADSQYVSHSPISAIVTCIHLFMAFEWLKEHDSSWEYLQMAITRAQKLKIDHWSEADVLANEERRMFLSTRLKVYYLLCLLERSHALLLPNTLAYDQPLRLPGRPWADTAALRASLPPSALTGLQTGHIRLFDLVDDRLISCSRARCSRGFDGRCWQWNVESAVWLQKELAIQLLDAIPGGSAGDFPPEIELTARGNLSMTIAWLQETCFNVCATHGHVSPGSEHACLRPTFLVDLLKQLLSSQAMLDACIRDVSLDCYYKLVDVALAAARLAASDPETMSPSMLGSVDTLRSQLLPLLFKVLAITAAAVGNHVIGINLVKAIANIC